MVLDFSQTTGANQVEAFVGLLVRWETERTDIVGTALRKEEVIHSLAELTEFQRILGLRQHLDLEFVLLSIVGVIVQIDVAFEGAVEILARIVVVVAALSLLLGTIARNIRGLLTTDGDLLQLADLGFMVGFVGVFGNLHGRKVVGKWLQKCCSNQM